MRLCKRLLVFLIILSSPLTASILSAKRIPDTTRSIKKLKAAAIKEIVSECTFGRRNFNIHPLLIYPDVNYVTKSDAAGLVQHYLTDKKNRKILKTLIRNYYARKSMIFYRESILAMRELKYAEINAKILNKINEYYSDKLLDFTNYLDIKLPFTDLIDNARTAMETARDFIVKPVMFEKVYQLYKKGRKSKTKEEVFDDFQYSSTINFQELCGVNYVINQKTLADMLNMSVYSSEFKKVMRKKWIALLEARYQNDKFLARYPETMRKLIKELNNIILDLGLRIKFRGTLAVKIVSKNGKKIPVANAKITIKKLISEKSVRVFPLKSFERTVTTAGNGLAVIYPTYLGDYLISVSKKGYKHFEFRGYKYIPQQLGSGKWGKNIRIFLHPIIINNRTKDKSQTKPHSARRIIPFNQAWIYKGTAFYNVTWGGVTCQQPKIPICLILNCGDITGWMVSYLSISQNSQGKYHIIKNLRTIRFGSSEKYKEDGTFSGNWIHGKFNENTIRGTGDITTNNVRYMISFKLKRIAIEYAKNGGLNISKWNNPDKKFLNQQYAPSE